MSETLRRVQSAAVFGKVKVSAHGYDELAEDGILFGEILAGVARAQVVEDYPDAMRGPTVLALQEDSSGRSIHVVWGIPKEGGDEAVVITAYLPDPARWEAGFLKRRKP